MIAKKNKRIHTHAHTCVKAYTQNTKHYGLSCNIFNRSLAYSNRTDLGLNCNNFKVCDFIISSTVNDLQRFPHVFTHFLFSLFPLVKNTNNDLWIERRLFTNCHIYNSSSSEQELLMSSILVDVVSLGRRTASKLIPFQ